MSIRLSPDREDAVSKAVRIAVDRTCDMARTPDLDDLKVRTRAARDALWAVMEAITEAEKAERSERLASLETAA